MKASFRLISTLFIAALVCAACKHAPPSGDSTPIPPTGPAGTQNAVPVEPPEQAYARARGQFAALQADGAMAASVPAEIKDASAALEVAGQGQDGRPQSVNRIAVADAKVQLAIARAESKRLAVEVDALRAQRDALRGVAAPAAAPAP